MEMSEYVYKCSAGETFDSVALGVFNDENYAPELMAANPEVSDKLVFDGGEELRLPLIEIPEEEDDDTIITADKAPWRE